MKLLKRIKNLWVLSGYEVGSELNEKNLPKGTKVSMIVKKPTIMAQIIKRNTPVQEFLKEENG